MTDRGHQPAEAYPRNLASDHPTSLTTSMDNGQDHPIQAGGQTSQSGQATQAGQPATSPPGSQAVEHAERASTSLQPTSQPLGTHASQVQTNTPQLEPVERPLQPILVPSADPESRPREDNGLSPSSSTQGQATTAPPIVQPSSIEKLEVDKLEDDFNQSRRGSSPGHHGHPAPIHPRAPHRALTDSAVTRVNSRRSGIDWIVPIEERKELPPRPKTLGERLQSTIDHANLECQKYAIKAKMTGYALNIAIGLQVLLGALTTAVSAAPVAKQGIAASILGGIATLVASYLARARGSNEPELSITRVKDLEQFQRECEAFVMDHGHKIEETGPLSDKLNALRLRFEDLLGNASGERKLAPPV